MSGMNQQEFEALLSCLNGAVEILERHRTPDPEVVAACDTLQQARARVLEAVKPTRGEELAPAVAA